MTARDMVIDGSTLEKRRDQRAEQLERFVGEMTPEDRRGFLGYVNQWTQATGVRVVPASQSLFDLDAKQKQLRDYGESHTFTDLAPVARRSREQRLESMVARLKGASPQTIEPMLRDIAGQYWREGAPVTVEALRAVASHFLNRSERRH